MSIAGELARFVTGTSVDDLPPLALERARMVIASTIASAAMGANIVSSRIIRELARERGGAPVATLWFDGGGPLPVADAARVNAVMSDAAASDDSDLRSIAHIGTIVSTTAIAMAERTGAGGGDVLAAMVLGYEIAGRIDEALTPGRDGRGFHGSISTIFGGAVVAGTLLEMPRGFFSAYGGDHLEDVASIVLSSAKYRTLPGPKHPTDLIGVAHSPAYFIAAAIADRGYGWIHASAEKVTDPVIARLIDKITVDPNPPPYPDRFAHHQGATVTITLKDGRRFSDHVDFPRGSAPRGIDWADVDAKYRRLVPLSGLTPEKVEVGLEIVHGFDAVKTVSELTRLLR